MNLKTSLRSGTSRFAHLMSGASLGGKSVKKAKETEEEKEAREKAEKVKKVKEAEDAKKAEEGDEGAGHPEAKEAKEAKDKKGEQSEEDKENDGEDEDDTENEDDEEEAKTAKAAGFGKALQAARRIERRRCAAIFASKAAVGRIPLACELAFQLNNAMSAKDAVRILAASPAEQPANAFAAAMEEAPRHSVGDEGASGAAAQTPDQRLFALCAKAAAKKG